MNAAVGKGNPITGSGPRGMPVALAYMPAFLLRLGSVLLLVGAVALAVLAFTRFEPIETDAPGSAAYEQGRMRQAQLSAVLGLAACCALLGAFACHEKARRQARPTSAEEAAPPGG
jgi:hypothetical protein